MKAEGVSPMAHQSRRQLEVKPSLQTGCSECKLTELREEVREQK